MNDISTILSKLSAENRLAHGFLFSGNDTKVHFETIKHLAKIDGCEQRGLVPCEQCLACNKINHDNQPDIRTISALKSEIVVGQVHELTHWLHIAPNELKRKYAWISDAQNLNASSSNALLKTLEEPPAHAVIFLSVEQAHQALITIRSRLMLVRFPDQAGSSILDGKTAPAWLDEARSILASAKKPNLEQLYDLNEQIAQNRDDLVWFLEAVQKTLKDRMEKSSTEPSLAFHKYEKLYGLSLDIERNAYQRYGNVSLYLDHFFAEWFRE